MIYTLQFWLKAQLKEFYETLIPCFWQLIPLGLFPRSSWGTPIQKQPPAVFFKKSFLKSFTKFTGNSCVRVSFLITLQASAFLSFSVNLEVFSRAPHLQNISGQLPLTILYLVWAFLGNAEFLSFLFRVTQFLPASLLYFKQKYFSGGEHLLEIY